MPKEFKSDFSSFIHSCNYKKIFCEFFSVLCYEKIHTKDALISIFVHLVRCRHRLEKKFSPKGTESKIQDPLRRPILIAVMIKCELKKRGEKVQ